MIKVSKFGGSSVANSEQFKKVKKIIESDINRKFIVTSALGKGFKDDNKITDLLYLCYAHVKYNVSYDNIFNIIKEKFITIKNELSLDINLEKEFEDIKKIIEEKDEEYLVSRGEYLTAKMLSEYLGATFIDAKDVIIFNYDLSLNMEEIKKRLDLYLKEKQKIVLPGFYGSLPNGIIKVMSRGGSDITGAILANVVNADVYENWTDVSGFLIADPRIVDNPKRIKMINYNELREMSYMGANVLHDEAIFPIKEKNIPINVKNTNDPNNDGTMIINDCTEYDKKNKVYAITGITGKKDFSVISLVKANMSSEVGFLRKVLSIFEKYNISIEAVPVGVDSLGIVVQTKSVEEYLYGIIGELKNGLQCDEVNVINKISLIAVVGRGMKEKVGISGKIFAEFGNNKINIKVINQSSDEICIIVGVENKDFERAINCIYDKFILEK